MTRPLVVRPDAEADVREIHADLAAVHPDLSQRFASRLRDVFERIESLPELFAPVWQDVRAVRLKQFRYVVYYVAYADRTEILAVLHGARDPSAWRSRV